MQPLINLKSFLAMLVILIMPAALLVAYFRNYAPEAAGHDQSAQGKDDGAAMGEDDMSAMKSGGDSKSTNDHGNMAQSSAGHSQPPRTQRARQLGATSAPDQAGMAMPSALPGFPGISHLYHVGSTGFFLDHPEHITLSIEQQKRLHPIKEQALLDKESADRKVQEAEQQLWKLTAVEQPDVAQVETKVRDIEKLRADQRLAFIRAVGEAAKVLTEEQMKILLGTAASFTPEAKPESSGNESTTKSVTKNPICKMNLGEATTPNALERRDTTCPSIIS